MFLTFLMSTDEACMDKSFTQMYFIIGILHFICGIVENLSLYAEEASAEDGVISTMEKWLIWLTSMISQVLRIAEMPMVGVLGYYSLKFTILEKDKWTHDDEKVKPDGAMSNNEPSTGESDRDGSLRRYCEQGRA